MRTRGEALSRKFTRILTVVGLAVLAGYLGAVAYLYFFQRGYVFKPDVPIAAPSELGLLGIERVTLRAIDHTVLTGWHAAAAAGQPTILYFHGNAGNVADRDDRFRQILGSGFGLLAMNYRGYGGSGGSPSEAGLFSDALEIFDWLAERTDRIVVYGESLGTAVACHVASRREAAALVLEAPFTSALDIAASTYPWVPVGLLMRDPFLSREAIGQVEEPLLILHGSSDGVVPVEHGRRLFDLANEPKSLAIVEGAGHSDLWDNGLWKTVLEFLQSNGIAVQAQAWVRRMPSLAG